MDWWLRVEYSWRSYLIIFPWISNTLIGLEVSWSWLKILSLALIPRLVLCEILLLVLIQISVLLQILRLSWRLKKSIALILLGLRTRQSINWHLVLSVCRLRKVAIWLLGQRVSSYVSFRRRLVLLIRRLNELLIDILLGNRSRNPQTWGTSLSSSGERVVLRVPDERIARIVHLGH